MGQSLRKISPDERTSGQYTAGMVREQAVSTESMWGGFVRTEPQMVSGWHHHGDYETTIYVVSGNARFEFGAGGQTIIDAGPGDFVFVPKGAVHRESNPNDVESQLVVVRAGEGEAVINVEGPDS